MPAIPASKAPSGSSAADVVHQAEGSHGAAFFDLDKTVIARSSMVAFGPALLREGMISRRLAVQAAWRNLIFGRAGASAQRIERYRRSAQRIITGWDAARVRSVVHASLDDAIAPIVFAEAIEEAHSHRRAGRRTILASAGPVEIVEPVAELLGFDDHLASIAAIDSNGCYTGASVRWIHGDEKAAAVRAYATDHGIDLAQSWAYSDAASDAAMLEAVGHPVAVNAERALQRIARERDWPIVRFERREGLQLLLQT